MREEVLIGWLCFLRYQFEHGGDAHFPEAVLLELRKRGWLDEGVEVDWQGRTPCGPTERGDALTDIHGPEWGLDTIPEEAEA